MIPGEAHRGQVTLAPSVRMLAVEPNVIRLRWGIWNFQEATLDLRMEPSQVQVAVRAFFRKLLDGSPGDPSFGDAADLSPLEKANLSAVVGQLRQAGFLAHAGPASNATDMARTLLGNLDLYGSSDSLDASVGFISDSPSATRYIDRQAADFGAKLEILPDSVMNALQQVDFTSGLGGLTADNAMQALSSEILAYDSLVACISRASILAVRSLNRLALACEKPVVIGFIDGPFFTVVGVDTPATGCLECFEQRSLARLEDHIGYHEFYRAEALSEAAPSSHGNAVESLLCAFLLNEAVLLNALGTSRFIGRALSVYLPTYEMQAQDVLRIATCPACGHVARDIAEELNFSSRRVIDEHVRIALGGAS